MHSIMLVVCMVRLGKLVEFADELQAVRAKLDEVMCKTWMAS